MNWLTALETPALLGVLTMLAGLAGMPFLVSHIHHRMLIRRAHTGTTTLADLNTVLYSKQHRNRISEPNKKRIVHACHPQNRILTEDEAREWAQDPTAFPDTDHQGINHDPAVIVRWLSNNEDIHLLLACFDAKISSQELSAHLDGTNPITLEQANFLIAFQQSPDGTTP